MVRNKVYLIGAGLGHPDLITIKGKDILEKADVIIYDKLTDKSFLDLNKSAEKIYIGDKYGDEAYSQDKINDLLVKKAKENNIVARLIGGNPYVFDNGEIEALHLKHNNIEFEVVPGISSSIGGLSYAGIPIVDKDSNQAFLVVTGHNNNAENIDYKNVGEFDGTIIFVETMNNLESVTNNLIENGKSADTAAAIVYNASNFSQKVVKGDLGTIYTLSKKNNITSPAVLVVGNVVKLSDELDFKINKPLSNKKLFIGRPYFQQHDFIEQLNDLGAEVYAYPLIDIKELPSHLKYELTDLDSYSYIIFNDVNAIDLFFDNFFKLNKDLRDLSNIKIVCIGPRTAEKLYEYGLKADYIPKYYDSAGLVRLLRPFLKHGDRILLPHSKNNEDYLYRELSKLCEVREIYTYKIENSPKTKDFYDSIKQVDGLIFTNPTIVKSFFEDLDLNLDNFDIFSIGPETTKELMRNTHHKIIQANNFTINGLVKRITDYYKE